MMKNLIIKNGRAIIDISAYVVLVLVVLSAVGVMTQSFVGGIAALLFGLVGFFLTYFFIYLLIDMRDTLKTIAEQGGAKSEELGKQ